MTDPLRTSNPSDPSVPSAPGAPAAQNTRQSAGNPAARRAASGATANPEDASKSAKVTLKHTLLIVDDTPENLTVLGEILMPYYRVRVAANGQRALQVAASEPTPELILLDIMMPDLDGYQVLTALRQNPKTKDIPVIFVTALDAEEDEAKGLDLGAADYIAKPLRPAIVLARVRTQLELKIARDRMRNQNEWLESEVTRRMAENQRIQDAAMRTLASIAEVRDRETGLHILRTQEYVRVLAETLAKDSPYAKDLSPEQITLYSKAAVLHDLGKVGIPDSILLKPGKLTADEFETMKKHAKMGADAIWHALSEEKDTTGLEFLFVAMDIAHYHHEKWDGTGYPDGLAGADIPLPARLMAMADVYDAVISPRVYKNAFSPDKAASIIIENSGTHFDPVLVDAFKQCQSTFEQIARDYVDHDPELNTSMPPRPYAGR
jgi:putative two-component system response regulator